MYKKKVFSFLGFILLVGSTLYPNDLKDVSASPLNSDHELVLYNATSGTIPEAPLMNFIDFPADAAAPTYSEGQIVMDTTRSGADTYAGWISNGASVPGFPILDRTAGFQVDFTLQVETESHNNNNRAGFSVIILGEDAMGVELAFWEDEIWAQEDDSNGRLFKHGEGKNFATTSGLTDYQVIILNDTYTLTANTTPILSGPLRDYSGFEGFPDPYETPNYLFLGDDTTSAQARIRLSFVAVVGTEPAKPTSTSTPLPTKSPTALPSATPSPIPTPTPSLFSKLLDYCPLNWFR